MNEAVLTPKNWKSFQHYSNRKPAWIKLHHTLLDDYQFACLPVASQALAPRLWLLASEYPDGGITASLEEISFRLRMSLPDLINSLNPLVTSGFFVSASNLLAACKQSACLEKEREREKEKEKQSDSHQEDSQSVPQDGLARKYAFEGQVIKLNQKNLDGWKKAYPYLSLDGELTARDAWLSGATEADRKNWFISTSKYLANRNMEAMVKTKGPPQRHSMADPMAGRFY